MVMEESPSPLLAVVVTAPGLVDEEGGGETAFASVVDAVTPPPSLRSSLIFLA